MKTNAEMMLVIERLFDSYRHEVESSSAKPLTKKVYIKNTENFIRWIAGSFHPGARTGILQSRAKNQ